MDLSISIIKTGRGLAGSRIGLIFAPPEAPPGSMVSLTEFLNEQPNIRAVPGYHGPNKNPVLRVSGLPDDASFLKLLQQDFPAWQQNEAHHHATMVTIDPDITFQPLDEVDHFPHLTPIRRYVKENANTLTGLSYMAGSLALLLAAWREPKRMPGKPKHDFLRGYSALSYFAASALLVAMSQKTDNPRDVYTILESVYPSLTNGDELLRSHAEQVQNKTWQFLQNYPWEVSMLLNSSAAGAHALSSFKRGRTSELVGALASLIACSMSAFVPEKGGRSMVPIGEWLEDQHGRGITQRLEHFAQNHPAHHGWVKKALSAMDWVQENPLKVSSIVSGGANSMYAVSGLLQKSPALFATSAGFGLGNYTQSQATKGRGDGFDSVVTAAANIISADESLKGASAAEIEQRIHRLAEKLTEQREIVHSEARLKRGITARVKRNVMNKQQEGGDITTGFLASEEDLLRQNPFADKTHWREMVAEPGADHDSETASMRL